MLILADNRREQAFVLEVAVFRCQERIGLKKLLKRGQLCHQDRLNPKKHVVFAVITYEKMKTYHIVDMVVVGRFTQIV